MRDASKITLGKLLDAGLTNFDVDVVIYHGDEEFEIQARRRYFRTAPHAVQEI